jgi:hypothetical protein
LRTTTQVSLWEQQTRRFWKAKLTPYNFAISFVVLVALFATLQTINVLSFFKEQEHQFWECKVTSIFDHRFMGSSNGVELLSVVTVRKSNC